MSERIPAKTIGEGGTVKYKDLYANDGKVYPRYINGFYHKIRRYTGIPLLALYFLLPWILIDGRQSVLFDLPERKFHVFWTTFWPQDLVLLAWLLIISAYTLFTVTVLFGRIWCGYTCPQTVWTMIYIAVERFFEGDRAKRMKRDAQPLSFDKAWRKGAKHFIWLAIALMTAFTFVGYFVPIRELIAGYWPSINESGMLVFDVSAMAAFWVFFFTAATYINAGWMREQVCKFMCPYARFQSVMYDNDTLAVYYDEARGERRGARKANVVSDKKGDCVDCSWCVQVCPTDIDIRQGVQYECINCGLCVDACNQVMDKLGMEPGLIRYTSSKALKTGKINWIRPRLIGYLSAVVIMIIAFITALAIREPVQLDVSRDRSPRPYRLVGNEVQNVYLLKIINMDNKAHTYDVAVEGIDGLEVDGYRAMEVAEGEILSLPVRAVVKRKNLTAERSMITFSVVATDNAALKAKAKTTFIGPEIPGS